MITARGIITAMGKNVYLRRIKKMAKNRLLAITIPLILSLVFAIGVILRVYNLNNVIERSPDEYTYTYLAQKIAQHGVSEGIKLVTREQLSNKELWIYFPPPPTRTGYLWLLSNVMKALNSADVKVGSYISFAASVISLLLLMALGLRFFNPWITLYALLFMIVSPMELAIARRTWQDAMVGCIGLSLIYFSCEISRNIKRAIWYFLLIVVGSYYVSVKESGIFIYGLCVMWLLWVLFIKERSTLKGLFLIIFSALGVGITITILTHISGGIRPIIDSVRCWVTAMPTNQYAIEYQSGPWYYFLEGFWIVSPVSAILCLIGIAGNLLPDKRLGKATFLSDAASSRAIRGIILFVIVFMTAAITTPLFQNMRYVSILYAPFYLISGLGLWYIISLAKVTQNFRKAVILIVCVLILMAIRDYKTFEKIFIRTGIKDVSIKMLRDYSR